MLISFDAARVRYLLSMAEDTSKRRPTPAQRGSEADIPAGLWLTGIQGIFLMTNASGSEGMTFLSLSGPHDAFIAHAREADPTKMDPDSAWGVKQIVLGDRPIEFLEAGEVRKALAGSCGELLVLEVSPDGVTFVEGYTG